MPSTSRLLVAQASVAVGAAALAALGTVPGHPVAGPQAPDFRYIAHLTDSGWDVVEAQIVKVAHAECAQLGHGIATADLIDKVARKYRISGQAAVNQLVAAEAAYCRQFLGH